MITFILNLSTSIAKLLIAVYSLLGAYSIYQYQFPIFHAKLIMIESWIMYYYFTAGGNLGVIKLTDRINCYLLLFDMVFLLYSVFMIKGVSDKIIQLFQKNGF